MSASPRHVVAFIRAKYIDGQLEAMAITEEGGLLVRRLFSTVEEAKAHVANVCEREFVIPYRLEWVDYPATHVMVKVAYGRLQKQERKS